MAVGASNKPAICAGYPKPICSNKGTKKGMPPKPSRANKLPMTEILKVCRCNNAVLTMGFGFWCECHRYPMNNKMAPNKMLQINVWDMALSLKADSAKVNAARLPPKQINPSLSSGGTFIGAIGIK